MHKNLTIRALSILAQIIVLPLFIVQSIWATPGDSLQLLSPTSEIQGSSQNQFRRESAEPFINRVGKVMLGPIDILKNELSPLLEKPANRIAFKGMHLSMTFFIDRKITVTVDSESHPADNVIILGGHENLSDISTFTMTITPETFLITYQDFDNAVMYRVVGNLGTGLGEVIEIDLKKIPPRYDSEPIRPPDN